MAKFIDINKNVFLTYYLEEICDLNAREFMVVHRVSRFLRKWGQYQDLMLLSEAECKSFSHYDKRYYGRSAREPAQVLFYTSEDVSNINNGKLAYIFV